MPHYVDDEEEDDDDDEGVDAAFAAPRRPVNCFRGLDFLALIRLSRCGNGA